MKSMIGGLVLGLMCCAQLTAADWPQWRGINRDGISQETGLLKEWPTEGPALRWRATDIGTGYSTPSVANGRVYVQTTNDQDEFALALDEETGEEVWKVRIGNVGKNRGPQYPGTRSTLTCDGDVVYGLASDGELVCLDAQNGTVVWQKHLKKDFGGKFGMWAYSESVLIDGDVLVCTPGGKQATLLALNKTDGSTIWEGPTPEGDIADYASIMLSHAAGKRQYVQFLRKGLVGVEADTGKFLWRYDKTIDPGANILTPIVAGDRIFSAGSRSGGSVISVESDGNEIAARELYFNKQIAASIGGAVMIDGHLYGCNRNIMFCAEFLTGEIKWTDRAVGAGSICAADGHLYVRGHNKGEAILVTATPEKYEEKGRFSPPDRSDKRAWPHPVIANGGLYFRDDNVVLCYDIKE